jgi:Ribbon-helix-helix domain
MRRTNVYLEERQLELLRRLANERGVAVAELVRHAVDLWLDSQGARVIGEDEWQRRFDELLERRTGIAERRGFSQDDVDRDVASGSGTFGGLGLRAVLDVSVASRG